MGEATVKARGTARAGTDDVSDPADVPPAANRGAPEQAGADTLRTAGLDRQVRARVDTSDDTLVWIEPAD